MPPQIEISRVLSEITGINAQFFIASAETFSRPEEFDVFETSLAGKDYLWFQNAIVAFFV